MTCDSWVRIRALFWRYVVLHRRSLVRAFDIMFWPVMELLVWGFLTLYLQAQIQGPGGQVFVFLIGALISWDLHYRSQQAITIAAMEEIWTRNLVNIVIAPIRLWEWVAANLLYGLLKVALVALVLGVLAQALYHFSVVELGWLFALLVASLLVFGWAIGLFTAGLLVRFGYAAEALIWGIPVLIQPFSCVFYPIETLPGWAQAVARWLPSTYAFEGLRQILRQGTVDAALWGVLAGLNAAYLVLGAGFFAWMLSKARDMGRLGRLGQE